MNNADETAIGTAAMTMMIKSIEALPYNIPKTFDSTTLMSSEWQLASPPSRPASGRDLRTGGPLLGTKLGDNLATG